MYVFQAQISGKSTPLPPLTEESPYAHARYSSLKSSSEAKRPHALRGKTPRVVSLLLHFLTQKLGGGALKPPKPPLAYALN